MKVIAIDYDNTITDNTPYPHQGDIRQEAKDIIPLLYNKGYILVLWTARKEPYYTECVNRLKKEKLFQYFTPLDNIKRGVTGKIEADIYLDDKSVLSFTDLYKVLDI